MIMEELCRLTWKFGPTYVYFCVDFDRLMCTGEVCALRKNIIDLLLCNEKLGALGNVMIMEELCALTWKFGCAFLFGL